ncbi:MAG: hypothetical protein ACPL5F_05900 [Moorellaceae bacterium]
MTDKEKEKGARDRRTLGPAPARPATGVGEFEFGPEVTPGPVGGAKTAKDKNERERSR